MLTYHDACADRTLYALWLMRTYPPGELAEHVAQLLLETGQDVPEGFASRLELVGSLDLAEFQAANFPFQIDDEHWLEYCRGAYPLVAHPSLTADQRNCNLANRRVLP